MLKSPQKHDLLRLTETPPFGAIMAFLGLFAIATSLVNAVVTMIDDGIVMHYTKKTGGFSITYYKIFGFKFSETRGI